MNAENKKQKTTAKSKPPQKRDALIQAVVYFHQR